MGARVRVDGDDETQQKELEREGDLNLNLNLNLNFVRRRIGGCGVKLQRLKGKGDIPSPRAAVIYSDDAV